MKCKICGAESKLFDSATILGKYDVKYFECPKCGFIQTEEPYWLPEVYESAITSSDLGLIERNIEISKKLDIFFSLIDTFDNSKSFLDFGAGYGMMVRMMRDRGYDFEWSDEYCENLFAKGHEKRRDHYDVVTSFEMLEHLPNPIDTLKSIFSLGDTLIFSTELVPLNRPKVHDWWYYGVEHGQHISFYTEQAMFEIARRFNKKYCYLKGLHFFTNEKLQIPLLKVKLIFKVPQLLKYFGRKRMSLMPKDIEEVQRLLKSQSM